MNFILEFAFIPYQGLTLFLFRTDPNFDLKLTCEITIRKDIFILYFIRMSFIWLKLDDIDKNHVKYPEKYSMTFNKTIRPFI